MQLLPFTQSGLGLISSYYSDAYNSVPVCLSSIYLPTYVSTYVSTYLSTYLFI